MTRRFRFVSDDGETALGETWLAHDTSRDDAAVRVEVFAAPDDGAAFDARLKRLRTLSDVSLPAVLDGGRSDRAAWVVTEHAKARSLSRWLAGHRHVGTLPSLGATQRIFEKVGSALRVIHDARTVDAHGHLDSRCVLVRRVGAQHSVTVIGLGSVTRLSAQGDDRLALLALLLEVLTTKPTPEQGDSWAALLRAPAATAMERLVAQRDDVPARVWDAILQLAARPSNDRTATVASLLRTMREAWIDAGRWGPPPAGEPEPPEAPREPRATADPLAAARVSALAPIGWVEAERPAHRPTPQPLETAPEPLPKPSPALPQLELEDTARTPEDTARTPEDTAHTAESPRPKTIMLTEAPRSAFVARAPAAEENTRKRIVAPDVAHDAPPDDDSATEPLQRSDLPLSTLPIGIAPLASRSTGLVDRTLGAQGELITDKMSLRDALEKTAPSDKPADHIDTETLRPDELKAAFDTERTAGPVTQESIAAARTERVSRQALEVAARASGVAQSKKPPARSSSQRAPRDRTQTAPSTRPERARETTPPIAPLAPEAAVERSPPQDRWKLATAAAALALFVLGAVALLTR